MRIHCLTTFMDGADRFERDEVRHIDDARAARFIQHGWARQDDAAPAPAAASTATSMLDVQSATLVTGDSNG